MPGGSELDKLVAMAPTLDNHHSFFMSGKYRDLRDGATYHIYDDCPAGERVIRDGNKVSGTGGVEFTLCDFCNNKQKTGRF